MKFPLKVRKIIKIEGKSFDDLSHDEIASMIEADSALSPDGNSQFDSSALDTFLHNAELTRPDLQSIREQVLAHIYVSRPGSKTKDIDTAFLRQFALELRASSGHP